MKSFRHLPDSDRKQLASIRCAETPSKSQVNSDMFAKLEASAEVAGRVLTPAVRLTGWNSNEWTRPRRFEISAPPDSTARTARAPLLQPGNARCVCQGQPFGASEHSDSSFCKALNIFGLLCCHRSLYVTIPENAPTKHV